MLSKNRRVPRVLFPEVIKSGKSFHSGLFSVRVSPSSDSRISVSISKKVSKLAVVRNRTRRRVYSALREFVKPGLYLLTGRPGVEKLKGEELKEEVSKLIR